MEVELTLKAILKAKRVIFETHPKSAHNCLVSPCARASVQRAEIVAGAGREPSR